MHNNKKLQRGLYSGKIAGVCAGVADYIGVETWLVRIIWLSGLIFSGGFFFILYIAFWLLLDKKRPEDYIHNQENHAQNVNYESSNTKKNSEQWYEQWYKKNDEDIDRTVEIKTKVWQAGEPPKIAFKDISRQFETIERRVRNIEGYVTSSEFTLKREINRL